MSYDSKHAVQSLFCKQFGCSYMHSLKTTCRIWTLCISNDCSTIGDCLCGLEFHGRFKWRATVPDMHRSFSDTTVCVCHQDNKHNAVSHAPSIILILVLWVHVCLSVCLSPARSRERNVVSLHFFRQRKEIHLASRTNCFSSIYNAWFEKKRLWNFPTGYVLEPMHARYTFRLP